MRVDRCLPFHLGAGNNLVVAGVEHLVHNRAVERGGAGGGASFILLAGGSMRFRPSTSTGLEMSRSPNIRICFKGLYKTQAGEHDIRKESQFFIFCLWSAR